tara:strand:+ start:2282 stop:2689 length:408 start_codon:yes stop_codon:yes gene_type:complete
MVLDNYPLNHDGLVLDILKVSEFRINRNEGFLGVLIYNIGIPDSQYFINALKDKKIKINSSHNYKIGSKPPITELEWKIIHVQPTQETRKLIRNLNSRENELYFIIDTLSVEHPLNDHSRIYGIDFTNTINIPLQ